MAYKLGEPTVQQYFDSNGDPLASGTLEFYLTGTSTPTNIYSDSSGTSAGSTITLDSNGRPANGGTAIGLYFDTDITYKIVLKDSSGTPIAPTIDPYKVPRSLTAAGEPHAYVKFSMNGTANPTVLDSNNVTSVTVDTVAADKAFTITMTTAIPSGDTDNAQVFSDALYTGIDLGTDSERDFGLVDAYASDTTTITGHYAVVSSATSAIAPLDATGTITVRVYDTGA